MKKPNAGTAAEVVDRVANAFAENALFYGHGTDNPESEAQWLVSAVLMQQGAREIKPATAVTALEQEIIEGLQQRRIREKIPLAYLLQEAWFAGHCFYVDERVLVPRSPIAELISDGFQPLLACEPAAILDLCCGSGCIGIACALAFPDSRVILSDLSPAALEVAEINIRRFGLGDRVTTRESDLFAGIPESFDLIVSNPPYVPEAEYRELPAEYHREPEAGLVCEGEGLAIPMEILGQARLHLEEKGLLILETGHTWQALARVLPELPFLWLDFEYGGEGVCALTAEQLQKDNQV